MVGLSARRLKRQDGRVIRPKGGVAVAGLEGAGGGRELFERLREAVEAYLPFHVAAAELSRRAGRLTDARTGYGRSLELVENESRRRHLQARLESLS